MNKLFQKHNFILHFFLIFCVAFSSTMLASHVLMHKISNVNSAKILAAESQSFESPLLLQLKSQLESQFLAKKSSTSNHDFADCLICFSAAIYSNTIFATLVLAAFLTFRLLFLTQISNRVKLAYLQSSFLSRAPPFLS